MSQRWQGKLKFFNARRAFGFIQGDSGVDIYIGGKEAARLDTDLKPGDRLEYAITIGADGRPRATALRLLLPASE